VRLHITHHVNAHFVDAGEAAIESFEHEGVQVTVTTSVLDGASFASVTCSGVVEVPEPTAGAAQGGPALLRAGDVGFDPEAGFFLPPGLESIWPDVSAGVQRAEAVLAQVGALIRWRFNLSGKDSVFKDSAATVETSDGRILELHSMVQAAMGDDRAEIAPGGLAEVAEMVAADMREPLAHQLLREAWNLRLTNSRSSLVIGVTAAEVGMKQLITELVPAAGWLVDELPSPPLARMMKRYLPELPIRADVEKDRRCPKQLRTILQAAVEDRNRVVHRGIAPSVPLRETLAAVREFLYLLDYYVGRPWATTQLSDHTVAGLGLARQG
jgi:hypothetical protein